MKLVDYGTECWCRGECGKHDGKCGCKHGDSYKPVGRSSQLCIVRIHRTRNGSYLCARCARATGTAKRPLVSTRQLDLFA